MKGHSLEFWHLNNRGEWSNRMAYFVGSAGERYVCLFFSRKSVDHCSGVLLPLNAQGIRLTSLLPLLAALICAATIAEIFTWAAYAFAPPQQSGSVLTSINWIVAWVSIFCAVAGAAIIAFSQLYAMKRKSFFHGGENCKLSIDRDRSIAMFLVNVLFAVNGILFGLGEFAASEIDAGQSEDSVALSFLGFFVLAVPGALRLMWLFRARGFSDINWGRSSNTSRIK